MPKAMIPAKIGRIKITNTAVDRPQISPMRPIPITARPPIPGLRKVCQLVIGLLEAKSSLRNQKVRTIKASTCV